MAETKWNYTMNGVPVETHELLPGEGIPVPLDSSLFRFLTEEEIAKSAVQAENLFAWAGMIFCKMPDGTVRIVKNLMPEDY